MSYENRSIERAFTLLECLHNRREPLTLATISRLSGMPRASVFRLLNVMCRLGYVHKNNDDVTYSTACKLHGFGWRSSVVNLIVKQLKPMMRQLAYDVGETVLLSTREGPQVICWHIVEPKGHSASAYRTGIHQDAHCTAEGKVLLSRKTLKEIQAIYTDQPLRAHGPNTIRHVPNLIREIQHCRRVGYAVDDQEARLGVRAVSAPILVRREEACFAITVAGSISRINEVTLPEIIAKVTAMAQKMAGFLRPEEDMSGSRAGTALNFNELTNDNDGPVAQPERENVRLAPPMRGLQAGNS